MKFGQLIDYNMRNMAEKLVPDPFLKNQNWVYLRIKSIKVLQFVFTLC